MGSTFFSEVTLSSAPVFESVCCVNMFLDFYSLFVYFIETIFGNDLTLLTEKEETTL